MLYRIKLSARLVFLLLCVFLCLGMISSSVTVASEKEVNTAIAPTTSDSIATDGTQLTKAGLPMENLEDGMEPALLGNGGIDFDVLCAITPQQTTYSSGTLMSFNFRAQFASAEEATVKIGIQIPTTTPALELSMFNKRGTEAGYEDVPMYSTTKNGITYCYYLVTLGDGSRRIEFTLASGDSRQGVFAMKLPNGITASQNITLTPEVIEADSTYVPTKAQLTSGTTQVTSSFDWKDVTKQADVKTLPLLNETNRSGQTLTYNINALNNNSGLENGVIFAKSYTVTDTLRLQGYCFPSGTETDADQNGVYSFFVDGKKLLQFNTSSGITVESVKNAENKINGFNISYTVENSTLTTDDKSDLPNMALEATIYFDTVEICAVPDGLERRLENQADFTAVPYLGDAANSTASCTVFNTENYQLTKKAYLDQACTQEAGRFVNSGEDLYYKLIFTNNTSLTNIFDLVDTLPAEGIKNPVIVSPATDETLSGKTVTFAGISIAPGASYAAIIKVTADKASFTGQNCELHNTAQLVRDNIVLADADVTNVVRIGDENDGETVYSKFANKTEAKVNDQLTYTITAKNPTNTSRVITVTDTWPSGVQVLSISGNNYYELLDEQNNNYTLEQVIADPDIQIAKIVFNNVFVGAGKTVTFKITGKILHMPDLLKNEVGNSAGTVSNVIYGLHIEKEAHAFNEESGTIGAILAKTPQDYVSAEQVVNYTIALSNIASDPVEDIIIQDMLPADLPLTPVTVNIGGNSYQLSVTQALLQRSSGYTVVDLTIGTDVRYALSTPLNVAETATLYLFTRATDAMVDASQATGYAVVNEARAYFSETLQTPKATATFYTGEDTTATADIVKSQAWVCKYDENGENPTATGLDYAGNPAVTKLVRAGDYVGYRIAMTAGADQDIPVYELQDRLPEGMEFVGIAAKATDKAYTNVVFPTTIAGLIENGESGSWDGSATRVVCNYNAASRTLTITPEAGGVLCTIPKGTSLYCYVIARVVGNEYTYTNTALMKVDASVGIIKVPESEAKIIDIPGENRQYMSAEVKSAEQKFYPGISKAVTKHGLTPDSMQTLEAGAAVDVGEYLEWQLQVKNWSDNSGSIDGYGKVNTYLSNFKVVDYLPAELAYVADSARVKFNTAFMTRDSSSKMIPNEFSTGDRVSDEAATTLTGIAPQNILLEPTVEELSDGRKKLTWDFTGIDRRIFEHYGQITGATRYGLMHVITFNTKFDTNHDDYYGVYTNDVTLELQDCGRIMNPKWGVRDGIADYENNSVSNSATVNVLGAVNTQSVKAVKNSSNVYAAGSSKNNNTVAVAGTEGELVTYTLNLSNTSVSGTLKNVTLIDELPSENDTGVVNRFSRGSQFSLSFTDNPACKIELVPTDAADGFYTGDIGDADTVDPELYAVSYGYSSDGLNVKDWNSTNTFGAGGMVTWGIASAGNNAIRIAFASGFTIPAGQTLRVSFQAAVSGDGVAPGEYAWNSFGCAYDAVEADETTVNRIYIEPPKVGIQTPEALISITKVAEGDNLTGSEAFRFVLTQGSSNVPQAGVRCTIGSQTIYTDSNGFVYLSAGQTAVFHVPYGTEYKVTEDVSYAPAFELTAIDTLTRGTVSGATFTTQKIDGKNSAAATFHNSKKDYSFTFTKIKGNDITQPLESAHFEVYLCTHQHNAACNGLTDPALCNHVHDSVSAAASCWQLLSADIESGADGVVQITGLRPGCYMLVEKQAPAGFKLSRGSWQVTVLDTGAVEITAVDSANAFISENGAYYLPNYLKEDLPLSGGIGSGPFVFAGFFLIGVAFILFFAQKKHHGKAIK